MADAKHTPGPWMYLGANAFTTPAGEFVQWGEFRISANSLDVNDEDYYRIGSVSNANDASANESNARLIAAAPELLEALQIMADGFARGAIKSKLLLTNLDDEATDTMPATAAEIVRAAIAKATGSAA